MTNIFSKAFFIEYLVHWRWNRFYLSFDSVVKYFACGFLLTTPMAIIFESIVSVITSSVWIILVIFIIAANDEIATELQTDPKKAMKDLATDYQAVFITLIFMNSFVVAALIEEMVKYFGYWMVVVPDLLPQNEPVSSNNRIDDEENAEGVDTEGAGSQALSNKSSERATFASRKSTGVGITVAMVSVALGFACCENLIYVFVYSPPSLGVGKTS